MNEEKKEAIVVLMLLSTMFAQVKHYETTKKINKLRVQIRKKVNLFWDKYPNEATELSKKAGSAWEDAKNEINDRDFMIDLPLSIIIIYSMLDDNKYQNLWFTNKNFISAYQSMNAIEPDTVSVDVENDSALLVEIFAKALGLYKDNGLKALKATVKNNLILEGKIK